MAACGVTAGNDEVCADVALVAEEVLLEHGHHCDDSRFAAGGESVQLEVGGDERGCEFCVCCCAGAGTPDLGCDVVELLTVLVVSSVSSYVSCCKMVCCSLPCLPQLDRSLLVYLRQ